MGDLDCGSILYGVLAIKDRMLAKYHHHGRIRHH